MKRAFMIAVTVLSLSAAMAGVNAQQPPATGDQPRRANPNGWQIPENAAAEANPVKESPAALKKGEGLFTQYCVRCHGAKGKGDGEDADADDKPSDLTDVKRADRNPDGVLYYKIWNGRKKPEMPAFKSKMTQDDVWTLIHYVKSLRGKA